MSINLVQWEGSTVTPKLDAIMYDDGSYGIIKGCAITHQGTNLLKIANGFIKIAGRLIEIAEETIQCQVSASGTVNGQLWIRLDLSSVTPAVFMTEAAAVLTPLTQNADCNFQNGIYELQLATYNIDESVITNLVETAPELERLRTALENIDLDASNVTYHSTTVEAELDEINDNLSGFKFYPTGTDIVGLIADDSAYTDENGNYVIWGTATANQLVEDNPNTYKSVPSEEDCRGEVGADSASPFSKGFEVFHTASGRYGTITRTLKSRPKFACVIVKDTTERSYTTYRDFVNNINYQQQSSRSWGKWNTDTKITFDEQTKVITVVTGSENGDYGCEELYVY